MPPSGECGVEGSNNSSPQAVPTVAVAGSGVGGGWFRQGGTSGEAVLLSGAGWGMDGRGGPRLWRSAQQGARLEQAAVNLASSMRGDAENRDDLWKGAQRIEDV